MHSRPVKEPTASTALSSRRGRELTTHSTAISLNHSFTSDMMTGESFQTIIPLCEHAHSTTRVKDPTSRVCRVKDPSDEVSSRWAMVASIAFNARRAAVHFDRTLTAP